jgi:tRNA-splicing ligase RtcB
MSPITQIFGTHEPQTLAQLHDVAARAVRTALMADGHVGFTMPIGGVAAYREQVSVVGVGYDIACGNAAIRTNLTAERLGKLDPLADEIAATISFGMGRKNRANDAPTNNALFEDDAWDAVPPKDRRALQDKARAQLGTVGGGNHYVDVFADEMDNVWVGVHFGSRGFGHTVASGFLALSQGKTWRERAPEREVLLDLKAPIGQDYWTLMNLAGRYAYAGREWVARKVAHLIGGRERELVHNHHNFAWRETHDGEALIVVRKGATPAFPGQLGFIGGSMGDNAVIIRGTEGNSALQRAALYSTVHGAGRVMSRGTAKTQVTGHMMKGWVREKGVVLRGGAPDESPHVYRRLPDVLTAQGDTIEIVHTLRPLIVVMAGADDRPDL